MSVNLTDKVCALHLPRAGCISKASSIERIARDDKPILRARVRIELGLQHNGMYVVILAAGVHNGTTVLSQA